MTELDKNARWDEDTGAVTVRKPVGGIPGGVARYIGHAETREDATELLRLWRQKERVQGAAQRRRAERLFGEDRRPPGAKIRWILKLR